MALCSARRTAAAARHFSLPRPRTGADSCKKLAAQVDLGTRGEAAGRSCPFSPSAPRPAEPLHRERSSARRIPARHPVVVGLFLLSPSSQSPSPVASSMLALVLGQGWVSSGTAIQLGSGRFRLRPSRFC
jgi:hypothetical protein